MRKCYIKVPTQELWDRVYDKIVGLKQNNHTYHNSWGVYKEESVLYCDGSYASLNWAERNKNNNKIIDWQEFLNEEPVLLIFN